MARYLKSFLLIYVVLFTHGCAVGANIAHEELESFVVSVDRAFMQKDIDAIGLYMSDAIEVTASIGGDVYFYDKQSYLAVLKENWGKADTYEYRKLASKVDVVGSHDAIIKEEVIERLLIGGDIVLVGSKLIVEVKKIEGKLLATRISAESEMRVDTFSNP